MPKNKTHSGAKDRYKVTATGKVMRRQAHRAHYNEHKPSRVTRRLAGDAELSKPDAKRARKLLGR